MIKKLAVIFLSLLIVMSFVACGKDKDNSSSDNSSQNSSVVKDDNPTQDYDDEWGSNIPTQEDKDQVQDLWDEIVSNGEAEVQKPNNDSSSSKPSSGNTTTTDKDTTSSSDKDDTSSSDKDTNTGEDGNLNTVISSNVNGIF